MQAHVVDAAPLIRGLCDQLELVRIIDDMTKWDDHRAKLSPGHRPFRSAHHALARVHSLATAPKGPYTWVIEGDIRDCFGTIDHTVLLRILGRTIRDRSLLHVVRLMLKAGAMENLRYHETNEGTPQGGVVSPLLANIYLSELDSFIAAKYEAVASRPQRARMARKGRLLACSIVRYADDFLVLIRGTEDQAQSLKREIADFLRDVLQMELSPEKTLVTPLTAGLTFLGYEIKAITGKRDGRHKVLLRPSRRSIRRYRENIRRILTLFGRGRDLRRLWWALNGYIRGWGQYFAAGVSKWTFNSLDAWTFRAVARELLKRDQGHWHHGWSRVVGPYQIPWRSSHRPEQRWRAGRGLGTWLDSEHKRALMLSCLSHLPIRYARQFGPYCPYRPEDRRVLQSRRMAHQQPTGILAMRWLPQPLSH